MNAHSKQVRLCFYISFDSGDFQVIILSFQNIKVFVKIINRCFISFFLWERISLVIFCGLSKRTVIMPSLICTVLKPSHKEQQQGIFETNTWNFFRTTKEKHRKRGSWNSWYGLNKLPFSLSRTHWRYRMSLNSLEI